MENNEDIGYILGLREGSQKAMKALVEKYKKKAYYLALGMVGNSEEAMDISQEAFVRVFKSSKSFDESKPFFPWFYSIISNLSKDCLARRERRDSKMVDIEDNSFLLIDTNNPETETLRKEKIQAVRTALMQLDFEDREIIVLKHFRDMPYDEIAKTLGIPKGTVMSRLYYARKKMAKILDEY